MPPLSGIIFEILRAYGIVRWMCLNTLLCDAAMLEYISSRLYFCGKPPAASVKLPREDSVSFLAVKFPQQH